MPVGLLVVQCVTGIVGGAVVGAVSMRLLRRQVEAVTAGKGVGVLVVGGMALRLLLIGGGMAAALVWGLWCGVAFAVAVVVTRQVIVRKVRSAA